MIKTTEKINYQIRSKTLTENNDNFSEPNAEYVSAVSIQFVAILNHQVNIPPKGSHCRQHTKNGLKPDRDFPEKKLTKVA